MQTWERQHRMVSKTFRILFRNCRALFLLWFALWTGPYLWCLVGSSQQQSEAFSVENISECRGLPRFPVASFLERSTALGRRVLETPLGTRALKARALLFLRIHKSAVSRHGAQVPAAAERGPVPQQPRSVRLQVAL